MSPGDGLRLTQYAAGGGTPDPLPAAQLDALVEELVGFHHPGVLVGLGSDEDAAAVRLEATRDGSIAILSTAAFGTPIVDDPFDWGRIAAAHALSDIYAMGGTPLAAINLVGWPDAVLPRAVLAEVLRGGLSVLTQAGCSLAGGHSITAPEPLYGMALTGVADPDRLMRNDEARAGVPVSLTKPLGVGLLSQRHRMTGQRFEHAVTSMTTLNDTASRSAVVAGVRAATDVNGFGLLGHLAKMCRASGVSAVLDHGAVPYLEGAREALRDGYVSGRCRRNLDAVRALVETGAGIADDELLLLADAQTSGGLLLAGEIACGTVIGEFVPVTADGVRVGVR
ncbi:MAG: selenide, water dikinase SelD [Austwickia sp.]|jgi:selenide,water dikinase|nr:selenide, water dikinase SelD [Austwickia sp.]MBK8436306.1 selenide, water dikinase SelD [Austwickia sp.]MBK9101984.1 selenide, water dikinase SelD [Austwickia sp.]